MTAAARSDVEKPVAPPPTPIGLVKRAFGRKQGPAELPQAPGVYELPAASGPNWPQIALTIAPASLPSRSAGSLPATST